MYKYYYFFGSPDFEFKVSSKSIQHANGLFNPDGSIYETNSVYQFMNKIIEDNYHLKRDSVNVIDIGAQVGLYSFFAKFLDYTNFYSFEPFPESYKLLNENLQLNNIQNVKTFNIGLSNKVGKSYLNSCINHNGFHTLGDNLIRFNKDECKPIEINTDTIDNMFFNNNLKVDYIKIDTEGWEYFILQGATNILKKYKPVLQLEWNRDNMKQCNVDEKNLYSFLQSYGYNVVSIAGEEVLFS